MIPTCGCAEFNLLSRRRFLGLSAGFSAGSLLGLLSPELLYGARGPGAKADSVILLWMNGGQSHLDTWDPKPGTATGGPFTAIPTAVKGIHVGQHLPLIAAEFKHLSLIRSLTSKEASHERAQYLMHTGYEPLGSFQHATLGSTVWKMRGAANRELPAYVTIGPQGYAAGHLGTEYAPYQITAPERSTENVDYHRSVDNRRFARRMDLLRALDKPFARRFGREEVIKAYADYYNAAHRMMHSPAVRAFDLTREPQAVRERYGTTFFGQGCLLARRLTESGVRFVEVALNGWDTHEDNFERVAGLCRELDQAMSALIADLRAKDRLHQTLIVLCGEFGRTPAINGNLGRDHWSRVWSAVLGGGGITGGRLIGESSPGGEEVARDPVQVGELHATICKCLDIDPAALNDAADGRPIRIVRNVMHAPILGLL
jgi:hypothetical protein